MLCKVNGFEQYTDANSNSTGACTEANKGKSNALASRRPRMHSDALECVCRRERSILEHASTIALPCQNILPKHPSKTSTFPQPRSPSFHLRSPPFAAPFSPQFSPAHPPVLLKFHLRSPPSFLSSFTFALPSFLSVSPAFSALALLKTPWLALEDLTSRRVGSRAAGSLPGYAANTQQTQHRRGNARVTIELECSAHLEVYQYIETEADSGPAHRLEHFQFSASCSCAVISAPPPRFFSRSRSSGTPVC